ncbi:hypothetical protein [Xenophilus sp. Marseille-Q4582]|uniref:hypothetical protein n=1 Tax=Xenophilus sp. Marseille-Q4582 TaxID=2866600 RepID=UPI001CE3E078|nr:hypothetical protein [Xenophilus sp. Marseille-Q4582]
MPTVTHWTATALDSARRHGLEAALRALVLPAGACIDDHVELAGPGGVLTFIVRRRCWQAAADGTLRLCIELDHPARPSQRG